MPKKLKKDIKDFVGAGASLGIGTMVIAGTGHGASVLPAFSTMGSMMSPVATGMMGMHTIRMLGGVNMAKRKGRRKRRR